LGGKVKNSTGLHLTVNKRNNVYAVSQKSRPLLFSR